MASGSLRRAADHLFFSGIALLLVGYVLIGFWPSYFAAGAMLAALPSRLMLASAVIIGPALARWPFQFIQNGPPIGLAFFYLLPPLLLVADDLASTRRVHRSTRLGLGVMVLVLVSFLMLPTWQSWLGFTNWVKQV